MTDHKSKARNGQPVGNTTTTYEFQFPQPKEKVPFKHFLYNPKDGTCLGRTASSWAKILIFYAIFYAVLAALFAICLQILFKTISDHEPKYKLGDSLIGENPGMGYRPLSEETERGSIIKLNIQNPKESEYWIELLDDFLEQYKNKTHLPNGGLNQQHCDFNTKVAEGKSCSVDIDNFGPCSPKQHYGYKNQKPCVFLKLNKIYGWEPSYYDAADLPSEMSKDLAEHIKSLPLSQQKQIWISCKGQHSVDNELIKNISYYPTRGFPSFYYPYKNVPDYLSPLVAIQIEPATYNQLISIECRAWARNIIYSGSIRDRMGSVTFQINIDKPADNNLNSTASA
ncbi:sodium/potassium-transporting ATPase subunit beta-1 [Condylostylus longicornis]|uniref:sodium/potassium-transporting ATPase subunit beta-1 n=1 Tax=Condylostylus longicornis TaxID=2530218 RepID=UPI00244DB943|nr:sodium/potassium-transporting ATPase subunit beta-1 [Condylostylus longicornis]XP_055382106.1 sodium/potassium-transporting ATPase subunit beta-1 [Condylostylus longicornis]XP_055382108.1 sodium/potassium-transporting ATPase subunit beta-1 [Condylostylus longicornis]